MDARAAAIARRARTTPSKKPAVCRIPRRSARAFAGRGMCGHEPNYIAASLLNRAGRGDALHRRALARSFRISARRKHMSTKALVFAMSCSAIAFGCGADQPSDRDENQEIIDNLVQAGLPASDIQVFDGKVYVGLDGQVSLQASREMLQTDPANDEEQYRTTNLVGTGVTNICVNGAAFTGIFSTALSNAIANYNNLGLRWHMTRTSG